MLAADVLKGILLQELDYYSQPGLVAPISDETRRTIPGVQELYIANGVPVAYFSELDLPPSAETIAETICELYMRVWNESRVPLLYLFLPNEIRVYNGFAEPARVPSELDNEERLLQRLDQLFDVTEAERRITNELAEYRRVYLDTGAFWTTADGAKVQRKKRADQRLLQSMDYARRRLLEAKIDAGIAYALLGRAIFVRFLEDRGILTSELIGSFTRQVVFNFRDALGSKDLSYAIFDALSARFNGDLFPVVPAERVVVNQVHLDIVAAFLDGQDPTTGQASFWPYDFKYIPVELISGIYDSFLNAAEREAIGAYYTPLPLVDFVLRGTLPRSQTRSTLRILDPACGSGVFLVQAYHKLVDSWHREHKGQNATVEDLKKLMVDNIFGVDIHESAIGIAAFSLHLALLDYLDSRSVQDPGFRFPSLKHNLIVSDFFSPQLLLKLGNRKFDRVVGNLPWGENSMTKDASEWASLQGYSIPDKQISQAFLLYAIEFCTEDGEIALVAPTRPTLMSLRGSAVREQFWSLAIVRAVANFSALVYELFPTAKSPAVALFYRPKLQDSSLNPVVYAVPKPSELSNQLGALVVDASEIRYLHVNEILQDPSIWKIALWGTPRDASLIRTIRALSSTLEQEAARLGWTVFEGVNKGVTIEQKDAPWLKGMLLLDTKKFRAYSLTDESLSPIQDTKYARAGKPARFQPPLALIRQSPQDGRCVAAFSGSEVVYSHVVSGVAGHPGQEDLLKWLVAFVNSPIVAYYQFLTSTIWAVERGIILHEEYKQMPFLIPDTNDSRYREVIKRIDSIIGLLNDDNPFTQYQNSIEVGVHEAAIAKLIFDIYELSSAEQELITDTLEYSLGFFLWSKQQNRRPRAIKAVQAPNEELITQYAEAFIESASTLLRYQGLTLNGRVYVDGLPLSVVTFELVTSGNTNSLGIQVQHGSPQLRKKLAELDSSLLNRSNPSLYTRRHVRIYDQAQIYFVRPNSQRFWSRSQARADADSYLNDLLAQAKARALLPA